MKPEPHELPSFSSPTFEDAPYPKMAVPTGPRRPPDSSSQRRRANRPGSDGQISSGPAVEADAALASDLILLVSKLEYHRAQIDTQGKARAAVALKALTDMINETATRAEHILQLEPDSTLMVEAIKVKNHLHSLEEQLPHSAVQMILGFFQAAAPTSSKQRKAVREAADEVGQLLEDFFSQLKTQFGTSPAAGQWAQTTELFLTELRTVIATAL